MNWINGQKSNSFPTRVSYCCDFLESNEVSEVRHGHCPSRLCAHCFVSENDMVDMISANMRTMLQNMRVRKKEREALPNAAQS